jgi:quercetin dioxygenase-like cupin family protein
MSGAYGTTSGTESRGSRPLIDTLMVFSLPAEIEALREEAPYRQGDRNSATLAKEIDFRVLLSVLRSGAALDKQDGDARASLQLLEGTAVIIVEGSEAQLDEGDVAVIDAGRPWTFRATTDCALVLTLAWPREKAGV